VGAAAPLQQAGAVALRLPESYYQNLATTYRAKRDRLLVLLERAGFTCFKPAGAYYIMTDISAFVPLCGTDDVAFARHLVETIGVAAVPGSSFYDNPAEGGRQVRFTFCKMETTLEAAGERLAKLRVVS